MEIYQVFWVSLGLGDECLVIDYIWRHYFISMTYFIIEINDVII